MDSFQRNVIAGQKKVAQKLNAKASDTFGPSLGELYSQFQAIPGLRGLWFPGANVADTGNVFDMSGAGRTLTYNGNPTINFTSTLMPYMDFDGTGDFLSRADEAGLDLLGTDTYVAAGLRGFTIGGWFYSNTGATGNGLIGKRLAAVAGHSYLMEVGAGPQLQLLVSGDGSNDISVSSTNLVTAAQWFWGVGRFTPSTEIKVWLDDTTTVNTTSIPASIFNSATGFALAAFNSTGVNLFVGRIAVAFIAATILSDNHIQYLHNRSRVFFGA